MLLGYPGIDVNLQNMVRNEFPVYDTIDHSGLLFKSIYFDDPLLSMCQDGQTAYTKASDKGHTEIANLLSTHLSAKNCNVNDQVSTLL